MDKIISLSAFGDVIKPEGSAKKSGEPKNTDFSENTKYGYLFKMLLKNSAQAKLLHWQSGLYGQHKALDDFWNEFNGLADTLAESVMGKYGKPVLTEENLCLELKNFENPNEGNLNEFMDHLTKCYSIDCKSILSAESDSELINIIDEILSLIEKTKYLLSLR